MTFQAAHGTTQAAEGLPRRRFTVAELDELVEAGFMADERVELIGGELVPMSAKGIRHEVLKVALLRHWYRGAPDDIDIAPETTFRFSEDTFLEPDVVLFDRSSGLKKLSGGTVLLVVEIADSSLRYDTGRKAALYAGFGVRELWVIDVVRLSVHVFRAPSQGGYSDTRDITATQTIAPAFAPNAFALRIADLEIEG